MKKNDISKPNIDQCNSIIYFLSCYLPSHVK